MMRLVHTRTVPLRVASSGPLVRILTAGAFSTNALPPLPLPRLEETMNKLLSTVEPHVTEDGYRKTKAAVTKFTAPGGVGPKLQKLLEERAASKKNWLSDWWLQSAYLEYRDPVIIYSSPGLVFPKLNYATVDEQLKCAVKIAFGALLYKRMIDRNQIKLEMMGKAPLDMSQYNKIFGTCRVPGKPADSLLFHPNSTHIVVVSNNQYFKVEVGNSDSIIAEDKLYLQLRECQEMSRQKSEPIGMLSALPRDNWYEAYTVLTADATNRETIKAIQSSLFVLSLDYEIANSSGDDVIDACHLLIHGGGSSANSGNRWYDKTLQLVVAPNGINGLTYEHSPAEGQPIAVLTDFIINYLAKGGQEGSVKDFPPPQKLNFNLTSEAYNLLEKAAASHDKLIGDLDMNYLHYTGYGKNFIKSQKMSPDSYIQMAIQYAFYKLHRVPAAHYESAQTRMYEAGRTETIRSCSNESVAFARAMLEKTAAPAEKLAKLRAAVDSHKSYASKAVQGFGVDRHLLGLKLVAKENRIPLPELFKDDGLLASAHMRLSTSQVASRYDAFMCYGPLTADGYGCCYNPKDNDMWFGISSFKSNPITKSEDFRDNLRQALDDMFVVLSKAGGAIGSKL
ncbi:carnitine O-acetyltransferase-like [Wyeomyia smithii]|uniref:carnitine O-acetyltransferase-like n=1 Tax=Wyeomyia smithii TaxID=174621 RepID=UPI002467C0D0|nr:carnitine O-acetyltransferase-like [Wyeomyia smithii]XP_055524769.1 carnitine O-acetyltransferase-like [Wyeomyia smithii]XP_055524770.1 carnitine O-acetyltransferase-like [Wyeomyia smithii]